MLVQQRRRRASSSIPGAECVYSHAGFKVGQEVTTAKRPHCGVVNGRIAKIVLAPFWKFAVVEDAMGQSHACDFEELS